MFEEKFDPYGERWVEGSPRALKVKKTASGVLNLGPYVFWLLVVCAIFARIVCFSANVPFEFGDVFDRNSRDYAVDV